MIKELYESANLKLVISIAIFGLVYLILFFIIRFVFRRLKFWAEKTPGHFDDYIIEIFWLPTLWLIFWGLFKVFSTISLENYTISGYVSHINNILIIISVAWLLIKSTKALFYYLEKKLDLSRSNNLQERKNLTQLKVFHNISNSIIIILAIAFSLMTFTQARTIGVSLLTSAGIVGILIGFAAQKSLGMYLAGIQLAFTQPIRLDDVVIVEGEWGRIEEITLTYVVVKIWDERRLILPVNYFLEKPFQNWTQTESKIMGSVFLYLDYAFPVQVIREILPDMVKDNPDWDGRVCNVQVTNTTERHKEIRVLLSSSDASANWDLRVDIREKLIDYINEHYPNMFSQIRIQEMNKG